MKKTTCAVCKKEFEAKRYQRFAVCDLHEQEVRQGIKKLQNKQSVAKRIQTVQLTKVLQLKDKIPYNIRINPDTPYSQQVNKLDRLTTKLMKAQQELRDYTNKHLINKVI